MVGLPITESVLIACLVVALLLANQLRRRPLRSGRTYLLPALLVLLGISNMTSYSHVHVIGSEGWLAILASVAILGLGLGYLRARTVRVWNEGDRWIRQGTWLTAVLWVVTLGVHLVLDLKSPASASSLLLYLGATLAAQNLSFQERIRFLAAGSPTSRDA